MATNMTKKELIKVIEKMDKAELEKMAIRALTKPQANAEEEPTPVKAKRTKLNATDMVVELEQNGKEVTFGNLPRDAYGALKLEATKLGGTYDKEVKGFVFGSKAKATQFANITKVTAEARNEIRASWGWK